MTRPSSRSNFDLVSREQLSNFLSQAETPLTLAAIAQHFDYQLPSELHALEGRLRAMARDGQLIINRSSAYGLPKKMNLVRGIVGATDRSGFGTLLSDDGGEYLLSRNQMLHLLSSDVIIARLGPVDKDHGKRFASLVEFVQRPSFVGRVLILANSVFVRALKRQVPDIWIQSPPADLSADELVQVRVSSKHDPLRGSIVERYTSRGNATQEARIALANNSIPDAFGEEALAAAAKARARISATERKRRVDFSELALCTIDGADARDFDDAVYAEHSANGYRLIVAIADVSHFVKSKSALDQSAQQRGTSVYFPSLVAPMLPERLSNDLCSLRPQAERLALAVEINLDDQARMCAWRFQNAIIRSQARLEYLQAQSLLDNSNNSDAVPEAVLASLEVLQQIYAKRALLREQRGALEIDSYSAEFAFDEQGQVTAIHSSRRVDSHKLIEEMMLLANEAAATCLHQHAIPGLYRVHPAPDARAIADLSSFLRTQKIKVSASKLQEPKQYARLAHKLAQKPMAEMLQMALLRSMSQAHYSSSAGLHFGLNYDFYTHFTSPIRRYPDLLVHRQLKSAIDKMGGELSSEQQLPSRVTRPALAELQRLARQQSFLERRAESASREATDALKCHYLKQQIGAHFQGHITQVISFGLFVGLKKLPIDGLVHVSSLKSDYYHYDPQSFSLRGRHSRQTYAIGMPVRVQLVRVDIDKRRIDLRLVD